MLRIAAGVVARSKYLDVLAPTAPPAFGDLCYPHSYPLRPARGVSLGIGRLPLFGRLGLLVAHECDHGLASFGRNETPATAGAATDPVMRRGLFGHFALAMAIPTPPLKVNEGELYT